ncbi:MAG: hypothetical protein HRF45_06810 [Fimbriimonadia bacterium]
MNRKIQGFLVFSAATAVVAVAVGLGLRSLIMHRMLGDIPSASAEGVSALHFLASAAPRWVYSGTLGGVSGPSDWMSVSFPEAGTPRVAITVLLSRGEGAVNLLGLVDGGTGRFQAGMAATSVGFPLFEKLSGVVKGPAIVDGVPAVWIEAESKPRPGARDSQPRRWSGVLFAEGFGH